MSNRAMSLKSMRSRRCRRSCERAAAVQSELFVISPAARQFSELIDGIPECWSIGIMNLNDFFDNWNRSIQLPPQCSIFPKFHCSMWLA